MAELATALAPETPAVVIAEPGSLKAHIAAQEALERGAEPVAEESAETVETPLVATVEAPNAQAEADSTKPDAELSEAGKTLRRSRLDQRTARLKTEITELNEQLRIRKELRAQLEAPAQAPQAPPQTAAVSAGSTVTRPKPSEDQVGTTYASYGAYVEDLHDWKDEQRAAAVTVSRQQQESQARRATTFTTFEAKAAPFRATHSDFDAVVSDLPLTPLIEAVLSDEQAPALAYYLGTHREELAQLHQVSPAAALMRLGVLKASFAAPAKAAVPPLSKAVEPITPVTGKTAVDTSDPNTRTLRDHMRIENAKDAAEWRRRHGSR